MNAGKRLCAKPECKEFAQIFISRRDLNKKEHLYCSVSCAQEDLPRREGRMPSEKMGRSLSEERGETSPDISSFGSMISKEPKIQSVTRTEEETQLSDTVAIRPSTENRPHPDEKPTSTKSVYVIESDRSAQSQVLSIEPLQSSEEELFQSKSLIDESIRSTHVLAKDVMEKVKKSEKIEPALVNAACNAVKQVHALLKLKLEMHKEMRK